MTHDEKNENVARRHHFTSETLTRKKSSFDWTSDEVYHVGTLLRTLGMSLCQLGGRWKKRESIVGKTHTASNLASFTSALQYVTSFVWDLRTDIQDRIQQLPELGDAEVVQLKVARKSLLEAIDGMPVESVKANLRKELMELDNQIEVAEADAIGEEYWEQPSESDNVPEEGEKLTKRQARRKNIDESDPIWKLQQAFFGTKEEAGQTELGLNILEAQGVTHIWQLLNKTEDQVAELLEQSAVKAKEEAEESGRELEFDPTEIIRAVEVRIHEALQNHGFTYKNRNKPVSFELPHWKYEFSSTARRQMAENSAAETMKRHTDKIWKLAKEREETAERIANGKKGLEPFRLVSPKTRFNKAESLTGSVGRLLASTQEAVNLALDGKYPIVWLAQVGRLFDTWSLIDGLPLTVEIEQGGEQLRVVNVGMEVSLFGIFCTATFDEDGYEYDFNDRLYSLPEHVGDVVEKNRILRVTSKAIADNHYMKKAKERWENDGREFQLKKHSGLEGGYDLPKLISALANILYEWFAQVEVNCFQKDTTTKSWVWPEAIPDQPLCWHKLTNNDEAAFEASMRMRTMPELLAYWEEEGREESEKHTTHPSLLDDEIPF